MSTILDRGTLRGGSENEWTLERVKRTEEGPCARCGFPLYVGNRAYFTEDGEIYCSSRCMREHQGGTDA